MSRIGRKPITIPEGVKVAISDGHIVVSGSKGELKQVTNPAVNIEIKDNVIGVTVNTPEDKRERALWGLYGSLIANMITGVTEGYEKQLEVRGVGFKSKVDGKKLVLDVGYSHQVNYEIPEGIEIKAEKNILTITGIDKQLVGFVASRIRSVRKPEPYKGKGIRYVDEQVQMKAGKAAKAAG
ncbi:MAG: 50S ribosomal protein L6 [Parcubacteria group bacterium]|nr:50S ribosomal protein L6 [Parcubacteria group bacterium]|tara:strand:+ start:14 stop:559 length:546 start_codon:yes stop_codon:yes gene_type:complete